MMTCRQVAKILEIYPSTVRRWCAVGQHPNGSGVWAEMIGRDWHIAATQCWCGRVVWLAPTIHPGEMKGRCECGVVHKEILRISGGRA